MPGELDDPLLSWREGAAKRRLLDAVTSLAAELPPARRIAAFDNDGTLWCERPTYVQAYFLIGRWREMVVADPSLAAVQPYKAAAAGDHEYFADVYAHLAEIAAGVGAAYDGFPVADFSKAVRQFFATSRHPRWHNRFTELTYRPMRELMDLLRDNGFSVFVCTGGGRDFVRVVAEELYGVRAHQVIGSAPVLEYRNGVLRRTHELVKPIDDGPGKPVHLYASAGELPAFAAGNSDGDLEMLKMSRFPLLLRHDDADREYAYDDGTSRVLGTATEEGWLVVSMKNDFATIFDDDADEATP